MSKKTPITVAYGDGIGPEIMEAVLYILNEAGALIEPEVIEIGEKAYLKGYSTGIPEEAWEVIYKNKVMLKAPITTPQGGGYKSLNVTIRKTLGLFANVRPAVAYDPFVRTKHPGMDLIVVRENEEDLYSGVEYQVSNEVYHAVKLISETGSRRIIKFAFEYARRHNRKKVTAMTKDNILKMTDGTFHKLFDEIAKDYPDIEAEHWIVDIGTAKLADTPERFDVVVTPNLYGDVISDMTTQISGSVGLGGSANIGLDYAMFEAIHGSAPRRAGQGIANPSGLLFGAIMMLVHIGQPKVAEKIHNAWLKTIEDGIHTYDLYREDISKKKVGTMEFAKAVVERLGEKPQQLKSKEYKEVPPMGKDIFQFPVKNHNFDLIGVDIFIKEGNLSPEEIANKVNQAVFVEPLKLTSISNRGMHVWPGVKTLSYNTDSWRLRFKADNSNTLTQLQILELMKQLNSQGFEITATSNLYNVDGERAFTLAQGE